MGKALICWRFPFCEFECIKLIFVDVGGFHGFQGLEVLQPVAALRLELLPPKDDGRLQSCRFGGLEACMPGGLLVASCNLTRSMLREVGGYGIWAVLGGCKILSQGVGTICQRV